MGENLCQPYPRQRASMQCKQSTKHKKKMTDSKYDPEQSSKQND